MFCVCIAQLLYSQDTLKLSLAQADSLLLSRNLDLVANRYNIDIAKARVIQAKLFSNPQLFTEWNLYNPTLNRAFDAGKNGQKIINLQQVFRIAGQRSTSIKLANEQTNMSELEYFDLTRTLKYSLHSTFYRFYYLENAYKALSSQYETLGKVVDLYNAQYTKGNIALKDLMRLKTTYFQLSNNRADIAKEMVDLQNDLQVLLADNRFIQPSPVADEAKVLRLISLNVDTLVNAALVNNPVINIAESVVKQNQLKLSIEKRNVAPNLMGGVIYDQQGSYVRNYTGVQLGFQIPIANRNQGGIKEAKVGIQQAEAIKRSAEFTLKTDVQSAFSKLQLYTNEYKKVNDGFSADLDTLVDGVLNNYVKNNISLLEFTDLFESYNNSIIELNRLKANLVNSYEDLNYVVGKEIAK